MDIIVELHGGILDGVTFYSDSPHDLDRRKAMLVAQIVGGCLRDAERREVTFAPGMVYSIPSAEVMEVARRENWSDARVHALMPYYDYEFWRHEEQDGAAHIHLRFKGVRE